LKLIQDGVSENQVDEWVKQITSKRISELKALFRRSIFSVTEKAKLQNTIGLLHSIHNRIKLCLKVWAGIQEQPRVVWNEIESGFERKIRTGAISNLGHIDLNAFFKDCTIEFAKQMKLALKKHQSLKVYGVLAAKFFIKKNDQDLVELKYFNTEAKNIYLTTPLSNWFTTKIQQPILRDIEEVQERDSGWTLHSIVNFTLNINK